MGKLTISMAIFNSYFDITRAELRRLTSAACVLTFQLNLLSRHVYTSVSASASGNGWENEETVKWSFLKQRNICMFIIPVGSMVLVYMLTFGVY